MIFRILISDTIVRVRRCATAGGGRGEADPEIPNSRSPDSRFGRETGNPRFPIRPGPGIGVPIHSMPPAPTSLASVLQKMGLL